MPCPDAVAGIAVRMSARASRLFELGVVGGQLAACRAGRFLDAERRAQVERILEQRQRCSWLGRSQRDAQRGAGVRDAARLPVRLGLSDDLADAGDVVGFVGRRCRATRHEGKDLRF